MQPKTFLPPLCLSENTSYNLSVQPDLLFMYYLRNNECPACRTHCASRRSLRDDPKYDALIAALYPDIEKYEEEVKVDLFTIYLAVFA